MGMPWDAHLSEGRLQVVNQVLGFTRSSQNPEDLAPGTRRHPEGSGLLIGILRDV